MLCGPLAQPRSRARPPASRRVAEAPRRHSMSSRGTAAGLSRVHPRPASLRSRPAPHRGGNRSSPAAVTACHCHSSRCRHIAQCTPSPPHRSEPSRNAPSPAHTAGTGWRTYPSRPAAVRSGDRASRGPAGTTIRVVPAAAPPPTPLRLAALRLRLAIHPPPARAKRPALKPASQRVSAPLSKIATSSRSPSTRATPAPAPLPLPTSLCVSGHAARLSSLARRGYSLSCAACPIARRRLPRKAALWPKKQRRPCVSRLPCTLSLHRSFRPLARAIPSSARRAYARCATWLTPMMPPPEVTATSLPPSAQFRQPRPSWLSPRTPSWAAN